MTYSLEFEIDELPVLQADQFANRFARTRYRKKWHRWVWLKSLVAGKPKIPLEEAHVTCVRHSASCPDSDNLVYSFKVVIDGLVRAGVLKNDTPEVIGDPTYEWHRCPRGKGQITVMVTDSLPAQAPAPP